MAREVYESEDGTLRFVIPDSWFVEAETRDGIYLANFRLTPEEEETRVEKEIWGQLDGEGRIGVTVSKPLNLQHARKDACREEFTTTAVHECSWITVDGHKAAWILLDHSNDGNCTCREMIVNGPSAGYRFSGGGCIACSGTPAILADIEAMFRSVELA